MIWWALNQDMRGQATHWPNARSTLERRELRGVRTQSTQERKERRGVKAQSTVFVQYSVQSICICTYTCSVLKAKQPLSSARRPRASASSWRRRWRTRITSTRTWICSSTTSRCPSRSRRWCPWRDVTALQSYSLQNVLSLMDNFKLKH